METRAVVCDDCGRVSRKRNFNPKERENIGISGEFEDIVFKYPNGWYETAELVSHGFYERKHYCPSCRGKHVRSEDIGSD